MLYVITLEIPKSTPMEDPAQTKLTIYEPWIRRIMIRIPPGHAGLAGLRIYYGHDVIFPHEEFEWVKGDDQFIDTEFIWKTPEQPCLLILKGYNQDPYYDHSFIVYLEAVQEEYVKWYQGISKIAQGIAALIGLMFPARYIRGYGRRG